MTKEEIKKIMPLMQAMLEGKTIQRYYVLGGEWVDTEHISLEFEDNIRNYRIKPESKYRPFKSQEECWNEMQKHQPFGWVKEISSEMLYLINGISNMSIVIMEDINSFKEAMNIYEFKDGTPFGIREE